MPSWLLDKFKKMAERKSQREMGDGGKMYYMGGEIDKVEEKPGLIFGNKEVFKDEDGKKVGFLKNRSRLAQALGASGQKLSLEDGGKMYYFQGGELEVGDPKKPDASKVRDPFVRTPTGEASFRNNEGMMQATGEGKIDAYNFTVPESGMFDDMSDEDKAYIRSTPFGKEYLSGEGSLDKQYNEYAAKISTFIDENPDDALSVINEMISSGNENFQVLDGKSDSEKLAMTRKYMTDKKIGDFHGAITLGEKMVPTVSFYDANQELGAAGFRFKEPRVLRSVGDVSLREGDVMAFQELASQQGVDVSQDTPEARKLFRSFTSENGSVDFSEGVNEGKDTYSLIKKGEQGYKQMLKDRAAQMRERQSRL